MQAQVLIEQDIKDFLKDNPQFFENNAQFLADIHLPSPHGNGTISLAERQQLAQRDKISALEERYTNLVVNAQANDAIANMMQRVNLKLQAAKKFDDIEQIISQELPEIFELNDTCVRIWAKPIDDANFANLVFGYVTDEAKAWVAHLKKPYCGEPPAITQESWFLEPATSIAIIPLQHQQLIGFLAFSSEHKNRFYPEMGTDFLQHLGDNLSAALSRYVRI